MKYDFDTIIPRRGTNSYKWDTPEEENVLPMCMYFRKMNYLIFGKFAIIIIMYVTDLHLPMVE